MVQHLLMVIGSIPHVGPFELFLISLLHDWFNNGHGMCYPVCGMVHIKEPLLLIEKSSPCSGGSGFPLSHYLSGPLPHLMPYNSIKCVECIVKSKCPIIKFECIYIQ